MHASAVRCLVEAAVAAPSGNNCQPWRFAWDGHGLSVLFDRPRAASLLDVAHRGSWMALGAALENMDVAAGPAGLSLAPEVFPHGHDADVVAQVRVERAVPTPHPLQAALARRCTNRAPYRDAPWPPGARDDLLAVQAAGVTVRWTEDPDGIARAARAAAVNEQLLFAHHELHAGLVRWLRWSQGESAARRDGLPLGTLGIGRLEQTMLRAVARWPVARAANAVGFARFVRFRSGTNLRRSGAFGLLVARDDTPERWVEAGRLMQRLWLVAAARGLAFHPLTAIVLLVLRHRVCPGDFDAGQRRLLEAAQREIEAVFLLQPGEVPASLVRVGVAPPPPRAPRRPLGDVFAVAPPAR
ncbi:MAG: hypothetical protein HY294_10925 [Candidatus Rokubacteria bacterium]|nr:hypothetical protein [Candidatus Rokubacteria bacterium]MBI3826498.1 hypothetical protein [Candidatus Rokubacteria bacterium]